jgi:hypothetical protein
MFFSDIRDLAYLCSECKNQPGLSSLNILFQSCLFAGWVSFPVSSWMEDCWLRIVIKKSSYNTYILVLGSS